MSFFRSTPRNATSLWAYWICVVICESDSAEAVANWALNWNNILDVDVVPVLDDNETRALGKSRETSS